MAFDLKDTYLFSQLTDSQLDRVRSFTHKIQLRDGAALFESGDEARRFFMVVDGQIKLSRLSLNGNEKVIQVVSAGHTFAEALMFSNAPAYPVRAVALGDTVLLAIDNRDFLKLLRESVDTCFRLMGDMSMRLRNLIKEIDDLTLQSASGRVAGYLCGKCLLNKSKLPVEIDLDTPKGVLASRLSVKPETFSRILNNFTSQGLVRVMGGRIQILDPDGLRAQAQSAGICGQSVGPGIDDA